MSLCTINKILDINVDINITDTYCHQCFPLVNNFPTSSVRAMRGGSGGAMLYTLYKLGMIYVAAVAAGADYRSLQSVSPPG